MINRVLNKINSKHKNWVILLIIVLISIVIEVLIFNYRFFATSGQPMECNYITGSGMTLVKDNTFEVINASNAFIEVNDIDNHIKSIYLDVDKYDSYNNNQNVIKAEIYATDEANYEPKKMGDREIASDIERSKYISVHLAGNSNYIKINFTGIKKGDLISIEDFYINKQIPFHFSLLRLCLCVGLMSLIYGFRPTSDIYNYVFDFNNIKQLIITLAFIVAEVLFVGTALLANPLYTNPPWTHHYEYQRLARALANGHFYLDEEPPETLVNMDNPYDTNTRDNLLKGTGTTYLWDHAYYEGKYYVYFGVMPVILMYLPFYLITGSDFSTVVGLFICSTIFIIAMTQLIRLIIQKWFPKTPFALYMVLCATMVNCTGLLAITSHGDFYNVPIIMALMFAVLGLCFWIKAIGDKTIHGGYLIAGCTCIAIIAGCRPQLELIAFSAFPFFIKMIVKDKCLFTKKTLKKTIGAIAPFVIVAGFLMFYNFMRFGSPMDFGANYNLTTNDMTRRFVSVELIVAGIFMYLMQPVNLSLRFPFIKASNMEFSFVGTNIWERMYGGVIINNPFLWAMCLLGRVKNILKKKKLYTFTVFLICYASFIIIVDTVGAGILPRYLCDFSWLYGLAATIIILAFNEKSMNKNRNIDDYSLEDVEVTERARTWMTIVTMISFVSIIYNVVFMFANTSTSISSANPRLYYGLYYVLSFWM